MAKKEKPIQKPEYEKASMDRRSFIRRIATAGGIAGATGYVAGAPSDWPLSMKDETGLLSKHVEKPLTIKDFRVPRPEGLTTDIGIARADRKYDDEGKPLEFEKEVMANLLTAALDQVGGIKHYIEKDDIVLIKPNVAFDRSPNLGATSNPDILETLIRLVYDAGAQEVRICDNPIESPPDCFAKSKIDQATANAGGRVYLPDSNSFKMLNTPGASLIENWWFFHRPFTNVDKVIGLAPVKDHNLCHASMGIKNWYGLLGGTRNTFHQDINGIISDLSMLMKPTLTILDATNILMENGPTGGDPSNVKKGNLVMASLDTVASDTYAFVNCLERPEADLPAYLPMAVEKSKLNSADGTPQLDMNWKESGRLKEMHI